jgi:cysteine desulfurase family protein (TIGR01976 family)
MTDTTVFAADAAVGLDAIRADFPALQRQHDGRPVAYFDGPGGTQVPRVVAEAMTDYLLRHNANTHWAYPTSIETDTMLWSAREAVADLLGASPQEIAFGANMTTLAFHVARAIGRRLGAGDEIVITELDHHANIAPWQALARERGITLVEVPLDTDTGALDQAALMKAIGPRTRVLALGLASNALGTITDPREATEKAKRHGALVFLDAVHYAPHAPVDVQALGCDFLACSAYKFYGPHVGALYARRDVAAELDLPRLEPAPDEPPESLETGTQNHEGIVGAAAAVDWLAATGGSSGTRRERLERALDAAHARGEQLLEKMWHGLAGIPGVRLFGAPPGTPRTPTVAFTVAGMTPDAVARRLAHEAVFASHGDFYAATVIARYGQAPDGVVRAGCSIYPSEEEVGRLVGAVGRLTEKRAGD